MNGVSPVTRCARRATRIGGRLGSEEKARANRRNRHHLNQQLREHGEEADPTPKLHTGWDVV